jgi:hypothetical protein
MPAFPTPQYQLGSTTVRLILGLLLIWMVRTILIRLSFIEGLLIPEVPFSAETIITFFAYVAAFVILLVFAQSLRPLWTPAFPRASGVGTALTTVIYVLMLSMVYSALRPLFLTLIDAPAEILLVLRVVLMVLAIILLSRAGQVIYQAIPNWLNNLRLDSIAISHTSCPNCSQLNDKNMKFCGYCAAPLADELNVVSET